MDELYHKKKTIHASIRSIGETSKIGDAVHQPARTEGGSVQDKSRPEGVKKDKPDRQAGDNQKDSCVRHPAAETSDDWCLVVVWWNSGLDFKVEERFSKLN